jgi:alginate O-acetyltransferase complex protein AlgI
MIGASYVFYAWWDVDFIWLLAGVSTLAQLGAITVARQTEEGRRRVALAVSIGFTLAPLIAFKYYGFFSLELTRAASSLGLDLGLPLVLLILPVGISFFTFMAISYIVDVYRGDTKVAGTIDTFLYLSFFPHLVAGPIVRPDELIPQIRVRRDPRHVDVAGASWLILGGLFKKVVVSSFLVGALVDPVFGDPAAYSAIDVFFGVVAYAIVIYADFSGYTDIAIGVAVLLGFRFPQNFDRPYTARSLQDFWRRWHMTLSRWLRDYLYIPLGGSKRGEVRTYVNIMATMVLGGLWHGAAWPFVVWGLFHGIGQAVGAFKRMHLPERPETPLLVWGQRISTFALVCVGWVFFRSDSIGTAFTLLGRLLFGWTTPTQVVTPLAIGTIVLMLAIQHAPPETGLHLQRRISRWRPVPLGLAGAIALFVIATLGPQGVAPFIYFQF